MSLSRAQVQIIATTEPFATSIREILTMLAPLMRQLAFIRQRRRSRVVTRNKQRRNW